MNERELRILRGIRDSLVNIQQEISSIRNSQERQEHQGDIQPVWIDPILTKHNETEANNSTYQKKNHSVQNSLRWATWFAFAAAAIYAGIARYQLSEIQQQTAWIEEQNRPWIELVDIAWEPSPPGPLISFMNLPTVDGEKPVVNIRLQITIKNIGRGVAHDVFVVPAFMFYKWDSNLDLFQERDRVCREATRSIPSEPFVWNTLFPDETRTKRIATSGYYSRDMFFHSKERTGDLISGVVFACVSYQKPRDYRTSSMIYVASKQDGFIEVGKPIRDEGDLRLARDKAADRAQ